MKRSEPWEDLEFLFLNRILPAGSEHSSITGMQSVHRVRDQVIYQKRAGCMGQACF
jgi:hypothetical protein